MDRQLSRDTYRVNLLKYTRRAFETLPNMHNPQILDIGCGTGIPTLALAEMSDGQIVAVDIDQRALDVLNEKVKGS